MNRSVLQCSRVPLCCPIISRHPFAERIASLGAVVATRTCFSHGYYRDLRRALLFPTPIPSALIRYFHHVQDISMAIFNLPISPNLKFLERPADFYNG